MTVVHETGFLDYLLENGILDASACERVKKAAEGAGTYPHVVIIELGLMEEEEVYRHLSRYCRLPLVRRSRFPDDNPAEGLVDLEFLERHGLVVLTVREDVLEVALFDPFQREAVDALAFLSGRDVRVSLALRHEIEQWLRTQKARRLKREEAHGAYSDTDIQRLRENASQAPVIKYVNQLLERAVNARATDIHIEPHADGMKVRFRIDGVLHDIEDIPSSLMFGVVSRIKIIGRLDIAERRLPQDGRADAIIGGRSIDLRISTMPVLHGESLVLRILDKQRVNLSFEDIGFEPDHISQLKSALRSPNGIVLAVGPTGSGKTTTLYAALNHLNTPMKKLFTVEDPVEYELPGVCQIQVAPDIGLTFSRALRSILRQDPDIIMIGEMRDAETARIGIQAALTGHLVLSTLHTNSASASITRLQDMGMESYLLSATMLAVVSQRLVRRVCSHCAVTDEGACRQVEALGHRPEELLPEGEAPAPRKGTGCAHCQHTGYLGRTAIAEILQVDEPVRALITRGAASSEIDRLMRERGARSILEDGLGKALKGVTTVEEVLRVVD